MANIGDKYMIEIKDLGVGNDTYYLRNSVVDYIAVPGKVLQGFEKYDPESEYQRGLNDAWEAARKIAGSIPLGGLNTHELMDLFGTSLVTEIVYMVTADQAIEKLRTYESEKKAEEEIKVGDEVKDCEAEIGIVFDRKDNKYLVVYFDLAESDIYSGESERGELKKTGRHFPQVAELLAALGGADDE